jgi:hypothetical protein
VAEVSKVGTILVLEAGTGDVIGSEEATDGTIGTCSTTVEVDGVGTSKTVRLLIGRATL